MRNDELIDDMVSRLKQALGDRLVSAVLYGPEVHGDDYRVVGDLNLMIVLADLEPATLAKAGEPVRWWLKKQQPWPRLFSPELIDDSLDVFPIEFLDIARHHKVLHGDDPLAGVEVPLEQLRLQCERELREKMMRLSEGYVEAAGRAKPLRQLIAASYASFAAIFRGCLHLLGAEVPTHDREVTAALCARLELDATPFDDVEKLAEGAPTADADALFSRYYRELARVVARVDQLVGTQQGDTP